MDLMTLRLAALWAIAPVLVAYADTPWRTFGQRFIAHRWAERMVLFSIELNLLLLWTLTKVLVGRDVAIAPESLRAEFATAGAALAWLAAGFAVWARITLGRWFSGSLAVRVDHELVTHGPYAVVRHPMYTAFVTLAVGLAIAWDSWVSLGFALLYLVPFWLHTVIEEKMFEAHFGDAWRVYRRRVPRLVPGFRPGLTATPPPRP